MPHPPPPHGKGFPGATNGIVLASASVVIVAVLAAGGLTIVCFLVNRLVNFH
jgi:hypothetical protein